MKKNRFFLVIFLPLALLTVGVTILIYRYELENKRAQIETYTQEHTALSKNIVNNVFSEAVYDLKVLSKDQQVIAVLSNFNQDNMDKLAKEFLTLLGTEKYDQVRFIDKNGMEVIRANYGNGQSYLVPENELQLKADRYYFQEAIGLEKGEIYASPFDLNIEQGKIEIPYKPMIRFATPLFDSEGDVQGIIITNYLGDILLNAFETHDVETHDQIFLINKNGYWLKGPDPKNGWGFMFENKKDEIFAKKYPKAWEKIKNTEQGQFYTSDGLFTFKNIYPLAEVSEEDHRNSPKETDYYWKIMNYVPNKALQIPRDKYLVIMTGILLLLGVLTWLLTQAIAKQRQAEQKVFELNKILKLLNKILRHDISNDLTLIQNSAEEYQQEKDQNYLDNIEAAAKRSGDTIDKIRDLESAISSGEKLKVYQLEKVISEVKKNFPEMNITVNGQAQVLADEAINSVIENIVRNAKVHGKTNKVDVSISKKGENIQLRLADQGKGIPDKIKDKLFKEGAKFGETGHTGLGLYIVKKTIERYGGKVWVEDNKPKGAVFVLQIPQAKA